MSRKQRWPRLASALSISTAAVLITGWLGFSACASSGASHVVLGSSRVVADFDTYTLRRVGLLPLEGIDPTLAESRALAMGLGSEFSARTGLEALVLTAAEVSEVPLMTPHRTGGFDARTIIELGKRHRLDALLVATLVDRKAYPPQRLSLQIDLVSTETGLSLWYGNIQADAGDARTKRAVQAWVEHASGDPDSDWKVVLLSPQRFYRFACYEILRQFNVPQRRS